MRRRNMLDRGISMTSRLRDETKLYRTLVTIAMLGIFLATGIIVLGITQVLPLSAGLFGTAVMIAILCLGLVSILPWVRRFEKGEYKVASITFICFIGAVALLWIISDWLVVAMVNNPEGYGIALLWFVKIAIILSLQLMVANVVALFYLKYKKTLIPFQIIAYLSYAFIDFYFTWLVSCIIIKDSEVKLSEAFGVLGTQTMITLLVLSIVYAIISMSIFKYIEGRRMRHMVNDYSEGKLSNNEISVEETENVEEENVQDKLEKIKKLYEQELITKEEYEAKKAEIIKDI